MFITHKIYAPQRGKTQALGVVRDLISASTEATLIPGSFAIIVSQIDVRARVTERLASLLHVTRHIPEAIPAERIDKVARLTDRTLRRTAGSWLHGRRDCRRQGWIIRGNFRGHL